MLLLLLVLLVLLSAAAWRLLMLNTLSWDLPTRGLLVMMAKSSCTCRRPLLLLLLLPSSLLLCVHLPWLLLTLLPFCLLLLPLPVSLLQCLTLLEGFFEGILEAPRCGLRLLWPISPLNDLPHRGLSVLLAFSPLLPPTHWKEELS